MASEPTLRPMRQKLSDEELAVLTNQKEQLLQ